MKMWNKPLITSELIDKEVIFNDDLQAEKAGNIPSEKFTVVRKHS